MRHAKRAYAIAVIIVALMTGMTQCAFASTHAPRTNPTCDEPLGHQFVSWSWEPTGTNSVYGIRAPIWFRHDGLLCTDTGSDSTNWIAIYGTGGELAIVQIGFIHEWIDGIPEWCRFYEDPDTINQTYNCSNTDDTWYYFRIQTTGSAYQVDDCGTAGNFDDSNCTQEDSYGPVFTSPTAGVDSEVWGACQVYILGETGDPVYYGNASWHVDVEDDSGWARRGWDYSPPSCTDYSGSGYTNGLESLDTRNSS